MFKAALCAATFALAAATAAAGPLDKTECIAPAKPGGGFDLTCKFAQKALLDRQVHQRPDAHLATCPAASAPSHTTRSWRSARPRTDTIVAFSGGSLLNLAQGKFGRYNENDVRWLAAVGADYGAVIVSESSPYTA